MGLLGIDLMRGVAVAMDAVIRVQLPTLNNAYIRFTLTAPDDFSPLGLAFRRGLIIAGKIVFGNQLIELGFDFFSFRFFH